MSGNAPGYITQAANLFMSSSREGKTQQKVEFVAILETRRYRDLVITHIDILNCRHCEAVEPSYQAGLKAVFG